MKTYIFSCSKFILSFLIFSFLLFLPEYGACEQPAKRDYWPTNGWKTSTPEMQGMDSVKRTMEMVWKPNPKIVSHRMNRMHNYTQQFDTLYIAEVKYRCRTAMRPEYEV